MFKTLILLVGLLLSNGCYSGEKTTLYDFRFWSSPERTRIVIDTDKGVRFSIKQQNKKLILKIKRAKILKDTYKKIFYTDKRLLKTHIKRDKTTYQFSFKLANRYKIKSYTLKPNNKYKHHRLVIDLYGKVKKSTIAKIKKISKQNKQSKQEIILIDAGHGGEDSGAIGQRHTLEKKITLSIAKKLAQKINSTEGMKAILTRKGDYYIRLSKRIKIAQANKASLFVSIHADSVVGSKAKGASVYTLSKSGGSTAFARRLERSQNTVDQFGVNRNINKKDQYLNKILWDLSRKDRDIQSQKLGKNILSQLGKIGKLHKKKPQKAGFVVLKTPAIPSVLVETAFISNLEEERRLNNSKEQNKIANAIYQGILNYYK
jgi:N-acetylmuramoyl-L-alanine amidase